MIEFLQRRKKNITKKANKFDAKKPKKPPTAFFYFLYVFHSLFKIQFPFRDFRSALNVCV